jgi:hypothetical protein
MVADRRSKWEGVERELSIQVEKAALEGTFALPKNAKGLKHAFRRRNTFDVLPCPILTCGYRRAPAFAVTFFCRSQPAIPPICFNRSAGSSLTISKSTWCFSKSSGRTSRRVASPTSP